MGLNSLTGRFLILTMIFVMLAEILIFVPSVARFREDYLRARLERAQIASLALLASDRIDEALKVELLTNAEVLNVVLLRDQVRQLILESPIPEPISATYDLRSPKPWMLIGDAAMQLFSREDRIVRVIGNPVREAGLLIEITLPTAPLRMAMIDYGLRILVLSAVISLLTATLLFFAVRRYLVTPMRGVVSAMSHYAAAPEDVRRIIEPTAGVRELCEAENALRMMQTRLTGALKQKERLAQLGAAVARVSHDLRNILTTAQLFGDRLEMSDDPGVRRMAPKLLASIQRAVSLCESTLAFGRADEAPPMLSRIKLADIVADVVAAERLAAGQGDISFAEDIPATYALRADPEQLYRILLNLTRNARQAIEASGKPGEIQIQAHEDDTSWQISICDTGPGLPAKAREHLFSAFQGNVRKGGVGLGLAIASELVRGHGGQLFLDRSDDTGTQFRIVLPKGQFVLPT